MRGKALLRVMDLEHVWMLLCSSENSMDGLNAVPF